MQRINQINIKVPTQYQVHVIFFLVYEIESMIPNRTMFLVTCIVTFRYKINRFFHTLFIDSSILIEGLLIFKLFNTTGNEIAL